ncbi:hypothetical protein [Streptomyces sp. x-80]|jgi:hypothetical protein|uniref:hypothetical protein n=1 Tax=Streptomyces sp. x-80 TaxID=2789282 RepID=UPI003980D038
MVFDIIFSAGGAAFLAALVQGMRAARDSTNRERRELVGDMRQARDELQETVSHLQQLVELYRRRSAAFEYQLIVAGIEPALPPGDPRILQSHHPEVP